MRVQIEAEPNQITIRSAGPPRDGREDAFRRMAERGDDVLEDEAPSLTVRSLSTSSALSTVLGS